MSDDPGGVDERLLADARARDAADELAGRGAPPLDDAVGAATGHRLRPASWLAIAASVLVVAALAVGLTLHGRGPGTAPADGGGLSTDAPRTLPSGVPPERGNERLFYFDDLMFDSVFVVPGDPRSLTIALPDGGAPGSCGVYGAQGTLVAETARTVRVRVTGFQYLPKSDEGKRTFGFGCYGSGAETVVRVRLRAPVGFRTVIDSGPGSRAVVPADPADLPTATVLPQGYRQASVQHANASDDRAVGARVYSSGGDRLILRVGPPDRLHVPSPRSGDQLSVGGEPAALTDSAHERCLSWTPPSGRPRRLCSQAAPGKVPLTTAWLLALANAVS